MNFELKNYQIFLNKKPLFEKISLEVKSGHIGAITGPSGSGKSTILADILGALPAIFSRQGTIKLDETDLVTLAMESRKVGILFQDDLLFPHLNVYENLAFGLADRITKAEKQERIEQVLIQAGLSNYQKRDIATLSGGQRSRISLLRTMLSEPNLILLDEPFSRLDKALRDQFRHWVFEQLADQCIPTILVTHDNDDIPDNARQIELEVANA